MEAGQKLMTRAQRRRMWLAALVVASAAFSPWGVGAGAGKPPPPPPPPPPATYSGDAQVLDVNLKLLELLFPGELGDVNVELVTAGPLPPTGGADDETLVSTGNLLPAPLLLSADIAHALTVGSGYEAMSQAFVASVGLGIPGLTIGVDVLTASSKASCSATTPGAVDLTGTSAIAKLTINDAVIPITTEPNQTINLEPLAIITINEQSRSTGAGSGAIDVNALHIELLPPTLLSGVATGDIVIGHAHSDISGCTSTTPPACPVKDFITGGGYITLPNGSRGTFGLHGGMKKDGSLWGRLNYRDHGTGQHIQGTAVTSYGGTGTARTIVYNTPIIANVSDLGEPGANDLFKLSSTTYNADGPKLTAGNIQLHQPRGCQTTTGGGGKGGPRK